MARFQSVVLDADSTLSAIEGIDWLAERRSAEVAAESASLTAEAMEGARPLESVYADRLARVQPTRAMVAALGVAYIRSAAPGALECIAALRAAEVRVVIVSGGLRQGLLPLARHLGVAADDVHAVEIRFDEQGEYAGLAGPQPLATQTGKPEVVRGLGLASPALAVGDGATDAAMRSEVAAFAAYIGYVRRAAIVAQADHVLNSFDELRTLVLP